VPIDRPVGPRQVVVASGLVVAGVAVAALVTAVLPSAGQDLVFHTPLAIVVLAAGTAVVLWRIGTGGSRR
jgi:hypothetical protein